MAFIYENGVRQDVTAQISAGLYKEAQDKNLTTSQLLNQKFPQADVAYGTAAEQIYASEGLTPVGKNKFGLRPLTTAEVLDGKGYTAAGNVKDNGDPFGTASRILFPSALIDMVESAVATDYTTDSLMFNGMVATYPHVKAGKIKLIAISSTKRNAQMPDTPTVAESLPGFLTGSFQGLLAPAGTPKAVIDKLHAEVQRIAAMPEVRERLTTLGAEPSAMSPAEFGHWLKAEIPAMAKIVKDEKITVE